jgi:hypothetical protein
MFDARNRARNFRDLAKGCRRRVVPRFSTEMRSRYWGMMGGCNTLAEAEEARRTHFRHLATSIAPN